MDGELDKNTKFYGRIEREDGSHYTEEFEFRFGLKRSFCAGRLFRRKTGWMFRPVFLSGRWERQDFSG